MPGVRTSRSLDRNIGCDLVECVSIRDDLDMWIDEEGKLKGAPLNRGATKAMQHNRPRGLRCRLG